MNRRFKASTRISLWLCAAVVVAGICSIAVVNWQMKAHALTEAQEKAQILLDRNLATHTYFSHQLKPALFAKMADFVEEGYFEPVWMSSTYAVREIDQYYHTLSERDYYYKEAAINARSPENEADLFERAFIEELNRSAELTQRSAIRQIDGRPFFVVLRRGETLEKSCLRCHSTPQTAPKDLVDYYGPEKSFHRTLGETVSAISIRIPLAAAYEKIDQLIFKLSGLFAVTLLIVSGLTIYLSNRWVFRPLGRLQTRARDISRHPEHLGEQAALPASSELADLTEALNDMSFQLRKERDLLEARVAERTRDLRFTNVQLTAEIEKRKKTIAELEFSLKEIKTLRGILPICSHCKKIRTDEGYWHQIESYIEQHSEADFSHSICPECAKLHYPDYEP